MSAAGGGDAFDRLAEESERERRVHHEGRQARWEQPVDVRVAAGNAIDGLEYRGAETRLDGAQVHLFVCARNDSRLRPGTRGRLSAGDPLKPAAHVELLEDSFDGRAYSLRLAILAREPGADLASGGPWVLDEDPFDAVDAELEWLRRARERGLGDWLEGREPPGAEDAGPAGLYAEGLQGSLAEAFARASETRNWQAIQGPPGTGKTFLLAHVALDAALRLGRRVLVTGVSHQAIHNALEQCLWLAAASRERDPAAGELLRSGVYKLGSSRAMLAGLPAGVRGARRAPRRPGIIVGATLFGLFASESEPRFDLALFDEAGQARLPLALGARLAAERTVFIGDDRQLPPVASAPEAEGRAPASVLALVRERYGAPLLLTETRRLNRELCEAVSDCFYDGRVVPSADAAGRRLRLRRAPRAELAEALDPEAGLVFVDVPHEGSRSVAEPEARWAAALAAEAVRCGLPAGDVGVISPFRAQCNRVRFLLAAAGAPSDLLVSTVERFQGQERELLVLSMAASRPAYLASLGGFLFSPNRLNVAVSRARTKVVVLGALETLRRYAEEADPDAGGAEGRRAFLRLLARARRVRVSAEAPAVEAAGTLP